MGIFYIENKNIRYTKINNGDFLRLDIMAIAEGLSANGTYFTLESMEKAIPTFYNKPILAYYNKGKKDVEEHNFMVSYDMELEEAFSDYDYASAEKPVGIIPESATVSIEKIEGKNWIVIKGALIWTEYNHRLIKIIEKNLTKKVSVEIEDVESHDVNGIRTYDTFKLYGITILGDDIKEGITGAKLTTENLVSDEEINRYKKHITYALNENDLFKKYIYEENKYGNGSYIKINKNKDSVSKDRWGSVDKTKLRETVLQAKNYKTAVKSVYLLVEDGWEEAPSEKLKYPVMQYKDGEFVYNAGGLLQAQQYGEKNDKRVSNKALSIREKLGLTGSKKEESMDKFVQMADEKGYVCLGRYSDKLIFAQPVTCEKDMESKEELKCFAVDMERCAEVEDGKCEFEMCDCAVEKVIRMDDDDEEEMEDKLEEEEEKDEKEFEEMKERAEKAEKERDEYAEKYAQAEKEINEMKKAAFKAEVEKCVNAEEDLAEDDKKDILEMCDKDAFADMDGVVREMAYKKYMAAKDKKEKLAYSLNISKEKVNNKKESVIDRLNSI